MLRIKLFTKSLQILFQRLAEVEARLMLQGRDELGLNEGGAGKKEMDGKEATMRLGAVNTQLGQLIDRSQATNERLGMWLSLVIINLSFYLI